MTEDGKNIVHVTTSGKEANYVRYALGILKGEGEGVGQRGGSKVQLWAVGKAATKCVSVCEIVKRECGESLHQWTGISSAPSTARSENDDGNGDGDQEKHDDMVDENDEVRLPALSKIRGRRVDLALHHMRGIRTRPIGRRFPHCDGNLLPLSHRRHGLQEEAGSRRASVSRGRVTKLVIVLCTTAEGGGGTNAPGYQAPASRAGGGGGHATDGGVDGVGAADRSGEAVAAGAKQASQQRAGVGSGAGTKKKKKKKKAVPGGSI